MERASSTSSSDSSSMASSSILSRTSSCSSSAVDDYIGTESCFDVLDNEFVSSVSEPTKTRFRFGGRRREEREVRAAAARQFPPPIPLLAQTENLLPHMPWVLKRVVTSDGRLILREEKVRHHEYFKANRSNGRLTLHLVPLDYDVFGPWKDDDNDEEECYDDDGDQEVEEDLDDVIDKINKDITIDDDKDNVHVASEDECRKVRLAAVGEEEETEVENGVTVGGGSPRGKCLKSCFVGMSNVGEIIRPVLS